MKLKRYRRIWKRASGHAVAWRVSTKEWDRLKLPCVRKWGWQPVEGSLHVFGLPVMVDLGAREDIVLIVKPRP